MNFKYDGINFTEVYIKKRDHQEWIFFKVKNENGSLTPEFERIIYQDDNANYYMCHLGNKIYVKVVKDHYNIIEMLSSLETKGKQDQYSYFMKSIQKINKSGSKEDKEGESYKIYRKCATILHNLLLDSE